MPTTSIIVHSKPSDTSDNPLIFNISRPTKTKSLRKRQIKTKSKVKRVRERRISEIVRAVGLWRRLYCGVVVMSHFGNETEMIRYSLDDAAQKVGISRKTLDDYLNLLN